MFIVKNNMTTLNSWLKLAECICFLRLMLVYGSPSLPIKKKLKKKKLKKKIIQKNPRKFTMTRECKIC